MMTEDLTGILERFCPMYVLLDDGGRILNVGPTLQKLRPRHAMPGQGFLDLFELLRPRSVTTIPALMGATDAKLRLRFRDEPQTSLKGAIARLPQGRGAVVNLSFGISILDAVRDYALTSADFSATDLAIELLYLVEAKSAAMEASRSLNLRLQGARIAAEEQAFTDMLTGLKNRRAMDQVLSQLISMQMPFALMHLDLDFFKSVNDRFGHAAGDHVLQQAARIMGEETRGTDFVARIGGDEFVLIFRGLEDKIQLNKLARRLIERLQEPVPYGGQTCRISASIGTALTSQFPRPAAAEILNAADLALYAAKRAGRGEHRFFSRCDEGDGCVAEIGRFG
ncbi:GGDEF domain-containing protein [Ruegeria sediminis]|uniref:GGDEF domain-containing protein n=1 Tax=Ruegeria sediminis TaxID=2583820 RepID=A0ABY2WZR0_9RHOB|nr:GGDEF domain-containing protein [Ruegeria sediminis]TMV08017.1 GGDEF domain-containing protein [Ruegeria sediminis]